MKSNNRSGHTSFLIMLALAQLVWVFVGFFVVHAYYAPNEPPKWASGLVIVTCPVALMLYLLLFCWIPALGLVAAYFVVEKPAEDIGIGVLDWPKERVYGMPKWLFDRLLLTALGVGSAYLSFGAHISWNSVESAISWQVLAFAGVTCAWIVATVWVRAGLSHEGRPRELGPRLIQRLQ